MPHPERPCRQSRGLSDDAADSRHFRGCLPRSEFRKLFWVIVDPRARCSSAICAVWAWMTRAFNLPALHFEMPQPQAEYVFKYIFRLVVIGVWLHLGRNHSRR